MSRPSATIVGVGWAALWAAGGLMVLLGGPAHAGDSSGTVGAQGRAPRWSARERTVAVELLREGKRFVEIVDTQSGTRHVVEGEAPLISPDGRHVLVEQPGEFGRMLFVVEVASGKELRLPGWLPGGERARWAPGGGRVLAPLVPPAGETEGQTRRPEIFLLEVATEGAGPRLFQLTEGGGSSARWIGRGDRLIYEAPDGRGGYDVYIRDGGGLGQPKSFWTEEPAPDPMPRGPSPVA